MSLYFRPQYARYAAPIFYRQAVPVTHYVPSLSHNIAPLFQLMNSFEQQFEHLQLAAAQAAKQAPRQHRRTYRKFSPKFDVKESEHTYTLEGEIPGFDAKDISIEFLDDGHTLQIKGKTVTETETGKPEAAAVEAAPAKDATSTLEQTADKPESETASVKSHQPSVEDDVSEPANRSAPTSTEASTEATPTPAEDTVAESSKAAEQQVAQQPQSEPETTSWITERHVGEFDRTFKFTSRVDQEAVKASLKNGILAITLPFARKPESRRIEIQ